MDTQREILIRQSLCVRLLFLCFTFFLLTHSLRAMEADLTITRMQTPQTAYAEFFIYILGSTLKTQVLDSQQTASVHVVYLVTQKENVVAGDNYILHTTGSPVEDFMDLHRIALAPGSYHVVVELTDNLDSTNTLTLSRDFDIAADGGTLMQSDILLLANVEVTEEEDMLVRSGVRMTPLPYAWYRAAHDYLFFYHEIYHSDVKPAADFFIEYSIRPQSNPAKVLLKGFKRLKPKDLNTLVQNVDIKGLLSGQYVLHVGVFTQDKQLLTSVTKPFMRTNPTADAQWEESSAAFFAESFTQKMDADSVRYALKALAPKISQLQVPVLNFLLEKGELENQRRFLHQYWLEINPANPEVTYIDYMKLARVVDIQYHSAFGYGFETDRGHIYLKYGAPDDVIAIDDEPSAPPYEIWFYNAFPATNQTDVRFLFYNPSLAGGDYRLLHSTARGEVNNQRWQMELYRDAVSEPEAGDFMNGGNVRDNLHRRAVEYFTD